MTAPQFVAAVTGRSTTATLTLTKPTIEVGDLLLLFGVSYGSVTLTGPSGWTLLGTQNGVGGTYQSGGKVWHKVATSGDIGGTVQIGISPIDVAVGTLLVYRGVNLTTPVEAHAKAGSASVATTITAPSVTATSSDARLVILVGSYGSGGVSATLSTPSPLTQRASSPGTWAQLAAGDEALAASGATGTRTGANTQSQNWLAFSVLVAPSATPGGGSGTLASNLPTPTAALTGTYTSPPDGPSVGVLAGVLPALAGSLSGNYVGPDSGETHLSTITDDKVNGRQRSGRLNLRIVNPLDQDATDEGLPASEGSTVRLHKQPIRIISPSLPAPTLDDGRPQ